MPTTRSDRLIMINLPIGAAGEACRVLAHVTIEDANEFTVVLDDSYQPAASRRFIGQRQIPSAYAPEEMGTLAEYLDEHDIALHALLAAGGASYGSLTLARAVHLMISEGSSASDSLGMVLGQSAAIRTMQQAHERAVLNMLST